jgi:hypothetical protein
VERTGVARQFCLFPRLAVVFKIELNEDDLNAALSSLSPVPTGCFRLFPRCAPGCYAVRRGGRHGSFAFSRDDFAPGPNKVIGTAGGWSERLALNQRSRRQAIYGQWPRAGSSEQLVGADRRCHQGDNRSGERARCRLPGHRISIRCCRLCRQRDRPGTRRQ